jgi:hypothetical protein
MPGGLLAKAQAFTGPREKPGFLQAALKALIDGESARPLARLGGIASPARQLGGQGDAPLKPGLRLHAPALGKTNAHATSRLFRPVILGGSVWRDNVNLCGRAALRRDRSARRL